MSRFINNPLFYKSIGDASKGAIKLGFKTAVEYAKGRKADPRLPARPDQTYADDWDGWPSFLGTPSPYKSMSEASLAAIRLGIKTASNYRAMYRQDVKLPAAPPRVYKTDWISWDDFLGRNFKTEQERRGLYPTLATASKAAIKLGIVNSKDYRKKYSQDEKLPCFPERSYADWTGWVDFLGEHPTQKKNVFYKTYSEASSAARHLGIKTATEYKSLYRDDQLLPSNPRIEYKNDWVSWDSFLGIRNLTRTERYGFYNTLEEVKTAILALNIKTSTEYNDKYCFDPKLPANPNVIYEDWTNWGYIFDNDEKEFYETIYEASCAAISLGIETSIEYVEKYKDDPKLHSSPHIKYIKDWRGWGDFLASDRKAPEGDFGGVFYSTIEEAKKAVKKLNIITSSQYLEEYGLDPLLPSSPYDVYWEDWVNWRDFLGTTDLTNAERHGFYRTLDKAKSAAAALGANTQREYIDLYFNDPMLPATPCVVYESEWLGWPDFFARDKYKTGRKYLTLIEASRAAKKLKVKSITEYQLRYKEDPKLPVIPYETYQSEWVSWENYLGVKDLPNNGKSDFYKTCKKASKAAIKLGIKTSIEYSARYKEDTLLPSNPRETYSNEWASWREFLKIKSKYYATLAEAKAAVKRLGFNSQAEYHAGCKQDPRLPFAVQDVYRSEWINWPDLFGRDYILQPRKKQRG